MKRLEFARFNTYTVVLDLVYNIWVILLAAIIGFVGSTTYFSFVHNKKYSCSMTVSMTLRGYTNEATTISLARTVSIAQTLDDVFQSDALYDVVRKDLGKEDIGTIKASQVKNTNLVSITATADSPQKAFDTLVSVKNNYEKVTDNVFNNIIIKTVVNPKMPTGPSNAKPLLSTGLFFAFCCACFTILVITFISYMRDTLKNPSDVEDELDTKLFGVVYHINLPKSSNDATQPKKVITNPAVGYLFNESYRRMAIKTESLKRTKGYNTFIVTSVAENEGKTTVSINLALALTQNGHRVLLIDCDLKKPSLHYFFPEVDREKKQDFHRFITDGGDISDYLYHDEATGLYVADSAKACEASSEKLSSKRFSEVIAAFKSQFDFIIIDTPPCGITVDAEIVSESADAVLLVARQDYITLSDINDNITSITNAEVVGCVFNNIRTLRKPTTEPSTENSTYYYFHKQS